MGEGGMSRLACPNSDDVTMALHNDWPCAVRQIQFGGASLLCCLALTGDYQF